MRALSAYLLKQWISPYFSRACVHNPHAPAVSSLSCLHVLCVAHVQHAANCMHCSDVCACPAGNPFLVVFTFVRSILEKCKNRLIPNLSHFAVRVFSGSPHQACDVIGPAVPLLDNDFLSHFAVRVFSGAPHQACDVIGPAIPLLDNEFLSLAVRVFSGAPHQACDVIGPAVPLLDNEFLSITAVGEDVQLSQVIDV